MNFKYSIGLASLLLTSIVIHADVNGTVFQDLPVNGTTLNRYGIKDSNELGVSGILVTAYPEDINTTTNSNGYWSLSITKNSRIEFSNIPSYLKESPNAKVKNSSVRFVKNGSSNINFGLHNPADFSDTTAPTYVLNIQENGTHEGSTLQSLNFINYEAKGLNNKYYDYTNHPGDALAPSSSITIDKIGSVWGKAYQKNRKRLFVSSMLQRHIGFEDSPSTIYVVDYSSNQTDDSKVSKFSLQGKTPSNGGADIDLGTVKRTGGDDYTLDANISQPNIDLDAYAKIGKISYGDIDIDQNSNTLWLLNLYQKAIISLDISGDTDSLSTRLPAQYLIENLANRPTCSNGELRPWAIKIHEGRGYLGLICDASSSKSVTDLKASVISFDLNNVTNGFKDEITFSLDYNRTFQGWHAWEDEYVDFNRSAFGFGQIYDQPILSNIEFDKYNNIYLAFFDRYATQIGTGNYQAISGSNQAIEKAFEYGEILKFCNSNGTYEKEGTGSCMQYNYRETFAYNNSSLTVNEFFNDFGAGIHESSLGAIAMLKGSNELLMTTIDPHPETIDSNSSEDAQKRYWNALGVESLSLTNGSIKNWYTVAVRHGDINKNNGILGKANGLGDIELITEASPIEIGDKIWEDSNKNGIQDADESGIKDVTLLLICNNNIEANATTDENGTYIFSNDPSKSSPVGESHQYNIASLSENNSNHCYVKIPTQSILKNYILTSKNIGEGITPTLNDSNGDLNNSSTTIRIFATDIPIAGYNNHAFDIGFSPKQNPKPTTTPYHPNPYPDPAVYSLGNRVWLDNNRDGVQDSNESGVEDVTVTLYSTSDCSGNSIATTTTNARGIYEFNNLTTGDYCIQFTDIPKEHTISPISTTNNQKDSDANSEGQIRNINLTYTDRDEDMGIYHNSQEPKPSTTPQELYILGDYVWIDSNHNGIQESNESGINNIKVNLYNNSDCHGEINATTITRHGGTPAKDGFYEFKELPRGNYCLDFEIKESYHISSIHQGDNSQLDSDANGDAQIKNIHLINEDLDEDIGIFRRTIIDGVEDNNSNSCECHDYNEDSASSLNNIGIIFLILFTSILPLLFRKELKI